MGKVRGIKYGKREVGKVRRQEVKSRKWRASMKKAQEMKKSCGLIRD